MKEETVEAYPLCWPVSYPREQKPGRAKFKTTFGAARDGIIHELKSLKATAPIISTNIPIKRDGLPYANRAALGDTGVAVYFTFAGAQRVLCCDKWDSVGDNMQSIRKTIEALRGLERWGCSDMLDRIFTGFKAITEGVNNWWEILGVSQAATEEEIKAAYREKAKQHHPDRGGDSAEFNRLTNAYQIALKTNCNYGI